MGTLESISDDELVTRLDDGDMAALEQIYLRYWAVLYQHARKMLRDDAKAEDVVHDIFAGLATGMGRLHIKTPLSAYLYRSVKNHIVNLYYKDESRHKYESSMKSYYQQGSFDTDETVIENELRHRIELAVADLPKKMREVFEMSRTDHLSHKEIADRSEVSEETVKTQIKRALKILRTKLRLLLVSL
jgi:RNA polymerase sigma-70 factor (ECF subfamily)